MSAAVALSLVDDEVAVRRGHARIPARSALQPCSIDERAGRGRNISGHLCPIGILKNATRARRVERLGFLAICERLRARRHEARRDRRSTRGRRPTAALHRFSASGFDRSRIPFRRGKDRACSPSRPASRTDSTSSPISRPPKCALPKMAPPTVPGVPAHASSPAIPLCIVHRTRPLIVVAASSATRAAVDLLDDSAARPDDKTAHAAIADEHVGSAAEERDRYAARVRDAQSVDDLVRRLLASRNHSAGPPTLNVVYRRERLFGANPLGPKPRDHLLLKRDATLRQARPPVGAAPRSRSAIEHASNSTQSPGAS